MAEDRLGLHIAVSGPVGAGKTTLTFGLARRLGWSAMLECADENPFLASYYADPPRFALVAQAWFQLESLGHLHRAASVPGGYVLDRTLDERHFIFVEPLHGAGFLSAGELEALSLLVEKADTIALRRSPLTIALRGPVDLLLERVRRRGKDYERSIDYAWLKAHAERYEHYWEQTNVPLLWLDVTEFDFNEAASLDTIARQVLDRLQD